MGEHRLTRSKMPLAPAESWDDRCVILYGLADRRLTAGRPLGQVLEIYGSRRAAEKALRAVLRDEPSWVGDISVLELPLVAFPLGTPSLN
jgi:hypothetical protein